MRAVRIGVKRSRVHGWVHGVARAGTFAALAATAAWLGAAPALAADADALYTKECAKCHGPDGKGDTPVGKAMKVKALPGHTEEQVVSTVRTNPKHKSVSAKLSDEQLAAVAVKVAGF